jgi:hypothetical protein
MYSIRELYGGLPERLRAIRCRLKHNFSRQPQGEIYLLFPFTVRQQRVEFRLVPRRPHRQDEARVYHEDITEPLVVDLWSYEILSHAA